MVVVPYYGTTAMDFQRDTLIGKYYIHDGALCRSQLDKEIVL